MRSGAAYHGMPADMWALGVTLYFFLFGDLPFKVRSEVRALWTRVATGWKHESVGPGRQSPPTPSPSATCPSRWVQPVRRRVGGSGPRFRCPPPAGRRAAPWTSCTPHVPSAQPHMFPCHPHPPQGGALAEPHAAILRSTLSTSKLHQPTFRSHSLAAGRRPGRAARRHPGPPQHPQRSMHCLLAPVLALAGRHPGRAVRRHPGPAGALPRRPAHQVTRLRVPRQSLPAGRVAWTWEGQPACRRCAARQALPAAPSCKTCKGEVLPLEPATPLARPPARAASWKAPPSRPPRHAPPPLAAPTCAHRCRAPSAPAPAPRPRPTPRTQRRPALSSLLPRPIRSCPRPASTPHPTPPHAATTFARCWTGC